MRICVSLVVGSHQASPKHGRSLWDGGHSQGMVPQSLLMQEVEE